MMSSCSSWEDMYAKFIEECPPLEDVGLGKCVRRGSYSKVYTRAVYGDTPVAIKTIADDAEDTYYSNMCLFSEAVMHGYLYDQYQAHDRKVRVPKIYGVFWLNRNRLCIVMQRFKFIFSMYRLKREAAIINEVIAEVRWLQGTLGFYHRDLHSGNIGIYKNNWFIFDFGMSCVTSPRRAVRSEDDLYKNTIVKPNYDLCIFLRSLMYQDRLDYPAWLSVCQELILDEPLSEWRPNTPVLHQGKTYGYQGWFKNTILITSPRFKKLVKPDEVELDVGHPHLFYYFHHVTLPLPEGV